MKNEIGDRSNLPDDINSPSHYQMGKIEVIDFIEDQKFCYHIATAIKYLCRYKYKGEPVKDLRKAIWYIERQIKKLEEKEKGINVPINMKGYMVE